MLMADTGTKQLHTHPMQSTKHVADSFTPLTDKIDNLARRHTNHHRLSTMKTSKSVLLIVAFISLAILAGALYLQHVLDMQSCPLCVIQRYAFAAIALVCLVCAGLPNGGQKAGVGLATLATLAGVGGAGTAIWHLWIISQPSTSCGRDALEAPMNALPPATLLPSVFKVDAFALCTTLYDPILGLLIPQWSLLWFVVLVVILVATLSKQNDDRNRRY